MLLGVLPPVTSSVALAGEDKVLDGTPGDDCGFTVCITAGFGLT